MTTYSAESPFTFSHSAVKVVTSPIEHALCGSVTTLVTFEGVVIDETSADVQYNAITRQFTVYSNDEGLLGLKPIVIESFLTDYPSAAALTLEFNIHFRSVCEDTSLHSIEPAA